MTSIPGLCPMFVSPTFAPTAMIATCSSSSFFTTRPPGTEPLFLTGFQ